VQKKSPSAALAPFISLLLWALHANPQEEEKFLATRSEETMEEQKRPVHAAKVGADDNGFALQIGVILLDST